MSKILVPLSFFVLVFILCIGLVAAPSCSTLKSDGPGDAVDCTGMNLGSLANLLKDAPQDQLLAAAESAGLKIGGCIISELVDQWMSTHAPGSGSAVMASLNDPRATLDKFRAKLAPGVTFKTRGGSR